MSQSCFKRKITLEEIFFVFDKFQKRLNQCFSCVFFSLTIVILPVPPLSYQMETENGNHDVTNRSSIPNGKLINSWRIQRCTDDLADNDADDDDDDGGDRTNGNDTKSKFHHYRHTNGGSNGLMNGYAAENGDSGGGGHRSYFRRSTNPDNLHKYPLRMNGLRKSSAYFQENGGTRSEFHDMYENSTPHTQFR